MLCKTDNNRFYNDGASTVCRLKARTLGMLQMHFLSLWKLYEQHTLVITHSTSEIIRPIRQFITRGARYSVLLPTEIWYRSSPAPDVSLRGVLGQG